MHALKIFTLLGALVFALSVSAALAQTAKEELPFPGQITRREPIGNYLAPLAALKEREQAYLNSEQWREFFFDIMSYAYADVGSYAEAVAYYDRGKKAQPVKEIESSTLDAYRPKKAVEVIAAAAEKEQVVMINEFHHVPMHRAFTTELLPILYKKGFRYLAVEAVNEADLELNRRGYPSYKTGTSEPVYGNLIRTALKLGFKVVPYEFRGDCKPPRNCQNERERGQAQNIYDRILRENPQAKILVHAGAGHIQELEGKQTTIMAAHFKNITKIDPFTIDQIEMIERGAAEFEKAEYRYALRKRSIKEPTIFQAAGGALWVDKTGQFDTVNAQVFHPRAASENERPLWLRTGGLRKPHSINTGKLGIPVRGQTFTGREMLLVQAFAAGEGEDAVPIDQIVLYPNRKMPALVLPKGGYRIQVIDKTGKVLGQYQKK